MMGSRYLIEGWRNGQPTPYSSSYEDDPKMVGLQVQAMLENGARGIVITQTETVPVKEK